MEPKALAIAAFGARGTGKTAWVIQLLQRMKPKRLLIWNHKHDPSLRDGPWTALGSLGEVARAAMAGAFQICYMVDHSKDVQAQFDLFCRIAYQAGNLTMWVDELPEVTKANRAPPAWKTCVNVGREYMIGNQVKHLTIIGTGQRPAECDKSFIGNLDILHTGRLGDIGDCKKIAGSWGIRPDELAGLPDLHYIEKRADSNTLTRGVLTFSKPKGPPPKAKKTTKA